MTNLLSKLLTAVVTPPHSNDSWPSGAMLVSFCYQYHNNLTPVILSCCSPTYLKCDILIPVTTDTNSRAVGWELNASRHWHAKTVSTALNRTILHNLEVLITYSTSWQGYLVKVGFQNKMILEKSE